MRQVAVVMRGKFGKLKCAEGGGSRLGIVGSAQQFEGKEERE
jgi:hypothetical protein